MTSTSPVQKFYSIFKRTPRASNTSKTDCSTANNCNANNNPSSKRKERESSVSSPSLPHTKVMMVDKTLSVPDQLRPSEISSHLKNSAQLNALDLHIPDMPNRNLETIVSTLNDQLREKSMEIARLTSLLASANARELDREKHGKDNPLQPKNSATIGHSVMNPIDIDNDESVVHVPNVPVQNRFDILSQSPVISASENNVTDGTNLKAMDNTVSTKSKLDQLNASIVGTSLVKYVSQHLPSDIKDKVDVCSYRGKTLDFIRRKIRYQVKDKNLVVVLGGGNDAQHYPIYLVVKEYSFLINEIRRYNRYAHIVLCSLPPRTDNPGILTAIGQINQHIRALASITKDVYVEYPAPTEPPFFSKYDPTKTHFSRLGNEYLARNMATIIRSYAT